MQAHLQASALCSKHLRLGSSVFSVISLIGPWQWLSSSGTCLSHRACVSWGRGCGVLVLAAGAQRMPLWLSVTSLQAMARTMGGMHAGMLYEITIITIRHTVLNSSSSTWLQSPQRPDQLRGEGVEGWGCNMPIDGPTVVQQVTYSAHLKRVCTLGQLFSAWQLSSAHLHCSCSARTVADLAGHSNRRNTPSPRSVLAHDVRQRY